MIAPMPLVAHQLPPSPSPSSPSSPSSPPLLRLLLLPLLLSLAAAAADSAPPLVLDGAAAHHTWDGFGGLSAGASSRLLRDYPEPQRGDILDLLYKPQHGASLQICKIEIGGDVMSTDGTEPSHEHSRGDRSCERGYELWLANAALQRNPAVKTFALAWGLPGLFPFLRVVRPVLRTDVHRRARPPARPPAAVSASHLDSNPRPPAAAALPNHPQHPQGLNGLHRGPARGAGRGGPRLDQDRAAGLRRRHGPKAARGHCDECLLRRCL